MNKFIGLVIVAALMASCGTKKSETTADSTTVAAAPTETANTLTAEQTAEGWKSLFDGQSMKGWVTFKNKENNSWEVVDGTLHCKSPEDTTASKRADIRTTEEFENFEFTFDFKIAPKHNSGVMFRVTEEYDVPYGSGPEFQVIDDAGYANPLKPTQLTAANYDMHVAENKNLKPAGEWNTGKLVVNGNHVEHWLNGVKVVEYEFASDDWKKRVAESKWKEFPGYGKAKKGYLDLQDHGGEVWFRNLFVKTL